MAKRVSKGPSPVMKRAKVVKSKTVIKTGKITDKSDEFNKKLKQAMDEVLQNPTSHTKIGDQDSIAEILSLPPHRIITPKQVGNLFEDMKKSDLMHQSSPLLKKTFEDVKNSFIFYEDLKHRLKSLKPKELERFTTSELFSYYSELLVLQAGVCGVLNQLNTEVENIRQKFELSSRNDGYKKQGE